jgi:hypothetical protein
MMTGRYGGRASDKAGPRDFESFYAADMSGRWGGRDSPYKVAKDGGPGSGIKGHHTSPETIAKVRALYERPGTPGEKAAAAAALRRYGVDPESFETRNSSSIPGAPSSTPRGPRNKAAQKSEATFTSTPKGPRNKAAQAQTWDPASGPRKPFIW